MEGNVLASRRMINLRAAKHRQESLTKPSGQSVLYFQPLMLTIEQIANSRKNTKEGKDAKEFGLAVAAERALQLAMMADASDANMVLVRFLR